MGNNPVPAEEVKKPRKPRGSKPKAEKSTGKVVVLMAREYPTTLEIFAKQPPANLRTKKQLEKWLNKECGAGIYAAVRTIVKMEIVEEQTVTKKVRVL